MVVWLESGGPQRNGCLDGVKWTLDYRPFEPAQESECRLPISLPHDPCFDGFCHKDMGFVA